MVKDREADDQPVSELRKERDLYLRLLRLGEEESLERFATEMLGLVVEVTGARRGYIELCDPARIGETPTWSTAYACSAADTDEIKIKISRGIISEALARGEVISTASAFLDPRFTESSSVQRGKIEAVLCGPIGVDPLLGVIYLEGRAHPGPFEESSRQRVELFGRLVAPLADRLIARHHAANAQDATRELRDSLRLDGVVGRSAALASTLRQAAKAASLEIDVLLLGDSGTGKSQLARVLHDNSPRKGQAFIEVNCAAIPEALFENELFGHAAGAYTGAGASALGKVGAASRGTLFLDEVGEIPLHLQPKLLQLLESKLYYPLGSTRPLAADVRIIGATNADLLQAVREKRFREDLYYRLRVLPIRLPSLDDRREDIQELAEAFCDAVCMRHGFPPMKLSRATLRALEAAPWPGNIRQLSHTVETGIIRAASDDLLLVEPSHLFFDDARIEHLQHLNKLEEATRVFQRDLVQRVLNESDWNIAEAARQLDVARSYVYTLVKTHGLKRRRP